MTPSSLRLGTATALLLCPSSASTQDVPRFGPTSGAPRRAGVYHVATGTWTRSAGDRAAGLDHAVLYNNTAPTGFYGGLANPEDINWTDEGRIPSCSGHPGALTDSYLVDGFSIGYCAGGVAGPVNAGVDFYDCYAACSDPRTQSAVFSIGPVSVPGFVPTWTSSISCWIVDFDLSGTSSEFVLGGDCDGVFDGTESLDSFGWTIHLNNGLQSNLLGPLLCGDPGGCWGCQAHPGDGTYYQGGACTHAYGFGSGIYGTGLGYNDRFYGWSPQPTSPNACYWFNHLPCQTPMGQFWLVVYGDDQGGPCPVGTSYCTGSPNSVGPGGRLTITGSTSVSAADTVANAKSIPNQPGIFFHGSQPIALPFGCGFLCAGGAVRRGQVVTAVSGNRTSYAYDESGARHSLAGFEGTTRYFQYWFRDPMNYSHCGNTMNFTDAVAVPLRP